MFLALLSLKENKMAVEEKFNFDDADEAFEKILSKIDDLGIKSGFCLNRAKE